MPDFNAKRHYRGKPCPYGHTVRYKKNKRCVTCANEAVNRAPSRKKVK